MSRGHASINSKSIFKGTKHVFYGWVVLKLHAIEQEAAKGVESLFAQRYLPRMSAPQEISRVNIFLSFQLSG
jgi:hypothetical protein